MWLPISFPSRTARSMMAVCCCALSSPIIMNAGVRVFALQDVQNARGVHLGSGPSSKLSATSLG